MSSTTTESTPKASTIQLPFSEARLRSVLDNKFVNRAINQRIKEIKATLHPYDEKVKALKQGFEDQTDASNKAILDPETKKVQTIPLSETKRKEYEAAIESFRQTREKLEEEKNALSTSRIRVGETVPVVLAFLAGKMTTELIKSTMDNAKLKDKKMIRPEHMARDAENLKTYPLFRSLPTWLRIEEMAREAQLRSETKTKKEKSRILQWW